VSQNTALASPAPNIALLCMKKDRIDILQYENGTLEGNANDRSNYDVT